MPIGRANEVTVASVIRRSPDELSAEIDDEIIMMNIEEGNYYHLNGVGSHIWNLLAEQRSVADICAAMEEAYDATREQIESDVLQFVRDMVARQVVEVYESLTP